MCSLWFAVGCCSVINGVCMFDSWTKEFQKLPNSANVDNRVCLFIVAGLS